MLNFVYETPTKVYFGKDEELNVGKIIAEFNPQKVLIHFGGQSAVKSGLIEKVETCLREEKIEYIKLGGVKPNPELSLVREGVELCRKEGVDFILAVGGGSVMDSSKAIAHGIANPDIDIWDMFSKGVKPVKTLNKGAILTIAAAGSEMSDSCVITNTETGEKRGCSCSQNRMNFAIENPELTYTVSAYQTACGAVDIAMHTIERYFCPGDDTYLTDAIAEAVIKSAMKAGKDSIENPNNYEARANMMWASSLAHNGLTECGRKHQLVVHQLEHEISGRYTDVAHGAGLAALWCSWARYVYKYNIPRWLQFAKNIWNIDIDFEHPEKTIEAAIDAQEQYYVSIGMPVSIRELGVKEEDLQEFTRMATRDGKKELIGYKTLLPEDVLAIYRMSYNR